MIREANKADECPELSEKTTKMTNKPSEWDWVFCSSLLNACKQMAAYFVENTLRMKNEMKIRRLCWCAFAVNARALET